MGVGHPPLHCFPRGPGTCRSVTEPEPACVVQAPLTPAAWGEAGGGVKMLVVSPRVRASVPPPSCSVGREVWEPVEGGGLGEIPSADLPPQMLGGRGC